MLCQGKLTDQARFRYGETAIHSPGYIARVATPEGGVMMINYATTNAAYEMHTGSSVLLFAQGPGAESIPASLVQADIFGIMKQHLLLP